MSVTKWLKFTGKLSLKLRPAISLKELDMAVKTSSHALVQEPSTELRCQLRSHEYICFLSENIYGRKGKKAAEVYGVHLDDFSGS